MDRFFGWFSGTFVSWAVLAVLFGCLYGCPRYNVYTSSMSGQATLAEADYSKQVLVQTANAKMAAARFDAQTEVIKAQGVANANKIMAASLGGPEGYLRWKYIEMLQETANSPGRQIIYVPTEAGLPILEAGRK